MSTTATFRVISPLPDARPDRVQVEKAAKALSALGFKVLRLGRFGVSVTAAEDRYQQVLGVKITASQSIVKELTNPPDSLRGLVDMLEVTPAPTYYPR